MELAIHGFLTVILRVLGHFRNLLQPALDLVPLVMFSLAARLRVVLALHVGVAAGDDDVAALVAEQVVIGPDEATVSALVFPDWTVSWRRRS